MATLWDMCGVSRRNPKRSGAAKSDVDPGTRVRLHIDGLGSPMKARVRGATDGEFLVGSNLEFLRVGRTLELEDVDRGGKRRAHIDRVDVEIDRSSKVPQLVVTLRYDDVTGEEPLPLTKVTRASRPKKWRLPATPRPWRMPRQRTNFGPAGRGGVQVDGPQRRRRAPRRARSSARDALAAGVESRRPRSCPK